MGVCMTSVELMALPTKSVWEAEVVGTSMEEMRAVTRATTGASFAGSSPPFLGRERAAVGVHVERDDGPLETPGGKGLPSLPYHQRNGGFY